MPTEREIHTQKLPTKGTKFSGKETKANSLTKSQ